MLCLLGGIPLLIASSATAQQVFDGNIAFRGIVDGNKFRSPSFDVEYVEDKFVFSSKAKNAKFTIQQRDTFFSDAVVSDDGGTAAVILDRPDKKDPLQSIVVCKADGKTLRVDYRPQQLSSVYKWVVELGAVANDGQRILAKCAKMIDEGNGVFNVNHDWVIISIDGNSFKVIDGKQALGKWGERIEK